MTLSFTAHNVRLEDGTTTYPAAGRTIDQTGDYLAVKNLLRLLYPDGWAGRSIVDLGCLEGGFAAEFARLGLDATGVEVRESNLANAEYLRERLGLPNLRYVCDDAWNVGRYGPFDIVFCVGLHYHIEDQLKFLREMAKACRTALVMDTHFAPEDDADPAVETYSLSSLTEHEGVPGRWYPEHELDAQADKAALEEMKWASWENRRSFWPTRRGLVASFREAGFPVVLEDFDQLPDKPLERISREGWRWLNARAMFVGLRGPADARPPKAPSPEERRLGLLLGRRELRGRTLLAGDGLPEPPANGFELVRSAGAEGPFADILAALAPERAEALEPALAELAAKLAPGGQLGLLIPDARVAGEGAFTPAVFLDHAESLARAGRFGFRIEAFQATETGRRDFIVRLSASVTKAEVLQTLAAARPLLDAADSWRPASAPEPAVAPPAPAPKPAAPARRAGLFDALKGLFRR